MSTIATTRSTPTAFPAPPPPPTSSTPRQWLLLNEEAEKTFARVACIFHSHCDVGAYFSAEDKAMAAPDGIPVMPEVTYWVVAVDKSKASAVKAYRWNGDTFVESILSLPA